MSVLKMFEFKISLKYAPVGSRLIAFFFSLGKDVNKSHKDRGFFASRFVCLLVSYIGICGFVMDSVGFLLIVDGRKQFMLFLEV